MPASGTSNRHPNLCAGIFFLGYAALQVPSNLILLRLGAPTWLGVTIMAWGIVAALFATLRNTEQFYILRFLLGITECGAFPGAGKVLVASTLSVALAAMPAGFMIGSVVSTCCGDVRRHLVSHEPVLQRPRSERCFHLGDHGFYAHSGTLLPCLRAQCVSVSTSMRMCIHGYVVAVVFIACICLTPSDSRHIADQQRRFSAGGRRPDCGDAAVAERHIGPARLAVVVPARGAAHHRLRFHPQGARRSTLRHCSPTLTPTPILYLVK